MIASDQENVVLNNYVKTNLDYKIVSIFFYCNYNLPQKMSGPACESQILF